MQWRYLRIGGVSIAILAVVLLWVQVFHYYQTHEGMILLHVESVIDTITFPYKLATLSAEPSVSAIRVPVHGVLLREIQDTWGAARSEGREHQGVDIFAARGTPVYAAAPGYVVRVGENDLGGVVVFTLGPGGVRYYYAHLDRIASGIEVRREVTTDTVLGFVGNTGNATGTPPHLHFGIYDRGPQNPYPFLIER